MKSQAKNHTKFLVGLLVGILATIGLQSTLGVVVTSYTTETLRQDLPGANTPGLMKRTELTWSSTTSADGFSADSIHKIVGTVVGVAFVPDGDVTALYDVVLNDEDGFDLLQGYGANLSLTESPKGFRSSGMPVSGVVTLVVDNTTGTGEVIIFWE